MTDMQRAGRIGGDEFEQDPLPLAEIGVAVARSLVENLPDHGLKRAFFEEKIDKTRAGDLGFLNQVVWRQARDDLLGQIARGQAGPLAEQQGDIARKITMRGGARGFDLQGTGPVRRDHILPLKRIDRPAEQGLQPLF